MTDTQKASNIQVGRYALDATGSVVDADYFSGDNNLLGVGATKTEAEFTAGKGLSATAAKATGATATEPLNEVFDFPQQMEKISSTYQLMVLVVLLQYLLVVMLDPLLQKP